MTTAARKLHQKGAEHESERLLQPVQTQNPVPLAGCWKSFLNSLNGLSITNGSFVPQLGHSCNPQRTAASSPFRKFSGVLVCGCSDVNIRESDPSKQGDRLVQKSTWMISAACRMTIKHLSQACGSTVRNSEEREAVGLGNHRRSSFSYQACHRCAASRASHEICRIVE